MSGEQNVVAFNVLWKLMVGIGGLALGLAGVLYAGQINLDDDKLDKEIFVEYRVEERRDKAQYRKEQKDEHLRISEAVSKTQTDVSIIKTILEERNKE